MTDLFSDRINLTSAMLVTDKQMLDTVMLMTMLY